MARCVRRVPDFDLAISDRRARLLHGIAIRRRVLGVGNDRLLVAGQGFEVGPAGGQAVESFRCSMAKRDLSSSAPPRCRTRPATAVPTTRPTAPSGCWRWPIRASASTSGCGPRSQSSPAPTATPTALVGTPEQVAEVFGDYYDLGVSHFLIRGFDPLVDAIDSWPRADPVDPQADRRATSSAGSPPNDPLHRRGGVVLAAIDVRRRARPSLRVGDQKGNSQAVMEAAGVLKDVPYKIEWKEFAAARAAAGGAGRGRDRRRPGRRCAVHASPPLPKIPVKAIAAVPPVARRACDRWCRKFRDQELRRSARQEDRDRPRLGRPSADPGGAGIEGLTGERRADRVPRCRRTPRSPTRKARSMPGRPGSPTSSQEEVLFESRRVITADGITPGLGFQVATPGRDQGQARRARGLRAPPRRRARLVAAQCRELRREPGGRLMNIPPAVPLNWLTRAKIRIAPIDDGVVRRRAEDHRPLRPLGPDPAEDQRRRYCRPLVCCGGRRRRARQLAGGRPMHHISVDRRSRESPSSRLRFFLDEACVPLSRVIIRVSGMPQNTSLFKIKTSER